MARQRRKFRGSSDITVASITIVGKRLLVLFEVTAREAISDMSEALSTLYDSPPADGTSSIFTGTGFSQASGSNPSSSTTGSAPLAASATIKRKSIELMRTMMCNSCRGKRETSQPRKDVRVGRIMPTASKPDDFSAANQAFRMDI